MKKFNTRRRLKGIILAAVSSNKWKRPIVKNIFGSEEADESDEEDEIEQDEFLSEQKRNKMFQEDQASSIGRNQCFSAMSSFRPKISKFLKLSKGFSKKQKS